MRTIYTKPQVANAFISSFHLWLLAMKCDLISPIGHSDIAFHYN